MRDPESVDANGAASRNETKPLRFAGLVLDLGACTLARESGEGIPLTHGEFTPHYLEFWDRRIEDMRKAGVPEEK